MEFSMKMSAATALYLVVGLVRSSVATNDQASQTLATVADGLDKFARDFPEKISREPEGAALLACAKESAMMIRERSIAILYGTEL